MSKKVKSTDSVVETYLSNLGITPKLYKCTTNMFTKTGGQIEFDLNDLLKDFLNKFMAAKVGTPDSN